MRRRVREAFRLERAEFPLPDGVRVDIAFVYVGKGVTSYDAVDRAMRRILGHLVEKFTPESDASADNQ